LHTTNRELSDFIYASDFMKIVKDRLG